MSEENTDILQSRPYIYLSPWFPRPDPSHPAFSGPGPKATGRALLLLRSIVVGNSEVCRIQQVGAQPPFLPQQYRCSGRVRLRRTESTTGSCNPIGAQGQNLRTKTQAPNVYPPRMAILQQDEMHRVIQRKLEELDSNVPWSRHAVKRKSKCTGKYSIPD